MWRLFVHEERHRPVHDFLQDDAVAVEVALLRAVPGWVPRESEQLGRRPQQLPVPLVLPDVLRLLPAPERVQPKVPDLWSERTRGVLKVHDHPQHVHWKLLSHMTSNTAHAVNVWHDMCHDVERRPKRESTSQSKKLAGLRAEKTQMVYFMKTQLVGTVSNPWPHRQVSSFVFCSEMKLKKGYETHTLLGITLRTMSFVRSFQVI